MQVPTLVRASPSQRRSNFVAACFSSSLAWFLQQFRTFGFHWTELRHPFGFRPRHFARTSVIILEKATHIINQTTGTDKGSHSEPTATMSANPGTMRGTPSRNSGRGAIPFATSTPPTNSAIPRPVLETTHTPTSETGASSSLTASRAKQTKRDEVCCLPMGVHFKSRGLIRDIL